MITEMLMKLENIGVPMKLVYLLSEELNGNPQKVALVHALTLDNTRPLLGLRGKHGLYATPEWWNNIERGVLPTQHVYGIVERMYVSGQDGGSVADTFDLVMSDGTKRMESCYVNAEEDYKAFHVGHRVDILYALDELKSQPASNGGVNYSRIVLEMAVSLKPVTKTI